MLVKLPLVTVYLPTRNRLQLLKKAVASVLEQSYSSIELIVVDDNSTDGTAEYLAEQAAAGQLRYFSNKESQGACVSRNRAIFAAQGWLITGLDDDDEFLTERVSQLVTAYMQKSSSASCVASAIVEVSSEGAKRRRTGTLGEITLDQLLHSNVIGNQVLTETSRLREIGGFDPQLPALQDYDAWVRLLEAYGPAYKLAEPSYQWRAHNEQISKSHDKRVQAMDVFMSKHSHLMSRRHQCSMKIVRAKLAQQRLSLWEAVRLARPGNFKTLVALLINQRASWLTRLSRKLRAGGTS